MLFNNFNAFTFPPWPQFAPIYGPPHTPVPSRGIFFPYDKLEHMPKLHIKESLTQNASKTDEI